MSRTDELIFELEMETETPFVGESVSIFPSSSPSSSSPSTDTSATRVLKINRQFYNTFLFVNSQFLLDSHIQIFLPTCPKGRSILWMKNYPTLPNIMSIGVNPNNPSLRQSPSCPQHEVNQMSLGITVATPVS
jgi:hypothetical protein